MNSFKNENTKLPLGAVWLMTSISEHKGKQDLYIKQSPQVLKALLEMALIESAESSNRIEDITIEKQLGEFSISDIEKECPDVSRVMIKKVLDKMQKEKKIKSLGKGQSAKWKRMAY